MSIAVPEVLCHHAGTPRALDPRLIFDEAEFFIDSDLLATDGKKGKRRCACLLMTAIQKSSQDFQALLDAASKAEKLNTPDRSGWTPLLTAAALNQYSVVEALVTAKADVTQCMEKEGQSIPKGATPLWIIARHTNNQAMCALLVKHGAEKKDRESGKAAQYLIRNGLFFMSEQAVKSVADYLEALDIPSDPYDSEEPDPSARSSPRAPFLNRPQLK